MSEGKTRIIELFGDYLAVIWKKLNLDPYQLYTIHHSLYTIHQINSNWIKELTI